MENFIENGLFGSDDEKPIKNKKKVLTKKRKKVVKKSDSTSSSGDDKDHKKTTKPIKIKKKVTTKDAPKKTLVEGDDLKKLQRKAKKLGAKYLNYSKRKNNKYVVEYEGKRFTSVQPNTKIILFTKILIVEKSIWQKRRKSQTKMVIILIILHHFQIIGL